MHNVRCAYSKRSSTVQVLQREMDKSGLEDDEFFNAPELPLHGEKFPIERAFFVSGVGIIIVSLIIYFNHRNWRRTTLSRVVLNSSQFVIYPNLYCTGIRRWFHRDCDCKVSYEYIISSRHANYTPNLTKENTQEPRCTNDGGRIISSQILAGLCNEIWSRRWG